MTLLRRIGNQFELPNGLSGKALAKFMNIAGYKPYNIVQKELQINKNDCLLEIGFSNGKLLSSIAKKHPTVQLYGIDKSEDMVKVAQDRARKQISSSIFLKQGDAKHLTYPSDMFDKVYTVNTMYFWQNLEETLIEIKRVLKKDGFFVNVLFSEEWFEMPMYNNYDFNRISINELETCALKVGFTYVELVPIINHYYYCIVLH